MPTSTAQMHIKRARSVRISRINICKYGHSEHALVLTEMIIAIIFIALMAGLVTMNFPGIVSRKQFEREARELIRILKMAQDASAESDKKYAVNLNFEEQTYTLKEYTIADWETYLDEDPILFQGFFSDKCYLEYVIFDDYTDTREPAEGTIAISVSFYAAKTGFQDGGNIVLLDSDGNPYSIIVNRLSRVITLLPGEDYEIPIPKETYELPF